MTSTTKPNCRPQKPPVPKNKPKLMTSPSSKTEDNSLHNENSEAGDLRHIHVGPGEVLKSACTEKTTGTNAATKRQTNPGCNNGELHSNRKVDFLDKQNNNSSSAVSRGQSEPDVLYSVVNKHKKVIDKTIDHATSDADGDPGKGHGSCVSQNINRIWTKQSISNMSRSVSEEEDSCTANMAKASTRTAISDSNTVQTKVAYFESLDDPSADGKPDNKAANCKPPGTEPNYDPPGNKTVKFKPAHDKNIPSYTSQNSTSTVATHRYASGQAADDTESQRGTTPKGTSGSINTTVSRTQPLPENNSNSLKQYEDDDYANIDKVRTMDDVEPYATSTLTDIRKSEPSTGSSGLSSVTTPTEAVSRTMPPDTCRDDVCDYHDSPESDHVVPPYAISRKIGALYSDDDNPYEDIPAQPMQSWSDSLESPVSTLTVDKHVYDYICTYEDQEKQWHVDRDQQAASRTIIFSTHSKQEYVSFVTLYERIKAMLWVEGIKASSVADINGVLDRLQTNFQCIWTRANEEDVEIICKKEDVDGIKKMIEEFSGGGARFIYEQAKSEMEPVPLEPRVTFVSPIACGYNINGNNVYIHLADITKLKVAAIVNAANGSMNHGSGVAKAIANAAGKQWVRKCSDYVKKNGRIKVTTVAETSAGKLPCSAVLHAVGPKWPTGKPEQQGECRKNIEETFKKVLLAVKQKGFKSAALPPISSGKYGCPHRDVANAIVGALMSSDRLAECQALHIVDLRGDVISLVKEKLDNAIQYAKSADVCSIPPGDVQTVIQSTQCATAKKKPGKEIWAIFTKPH